MRLVKQYSVFLPNEPGTLRQFTEIFSRAGVNIIAISQDVRYDSAIIRIAVEEDNDEISHAITKSGFTSVKADAVSIDAPDRVGFLSELSKLFGDAGINLSSIYGSTGSGSHARMIIVPNDIPKAIDLLKRSKILE